MRRLTGDLIDLTAALSAAASSCPTSSITRRRSCERSYPEIRAFFAAKRRWDPDGLFSNSWYARYAPALPAEAQPAASRPSSTSQAPAR